MKLFVMHTSNASNSGGKPLFLTCSLLTSLPPDQATGDARLGSGSDLELESDLASGSRSDSALARLASGSALAHPVTGLASESDFHSESGSALASGCYSESDSDSASAQGLESAAPGLVSDSALDSPSETQPESHSAQQSDWLLQSLSPAVCVGGVLSQQLALERTNISAPRLFPAPTLALTGYHSSAHAMTRSAAEL